MDRLAAGAQRRDFEGPGASLVGGGVGVLAQPFDHGRAALAVDPGVSYWKRNVLVDFPTQRWKPAILVSRTICGLAVRKGQAFDGLVGQQNARGSWVDGMDPPCTGFARRKRPSTAHDDLEV